MRGRFLALILSVLLICSAAVPALATPLEADTGSAGADQVNLGMTPEELFKVTLRGDVYEIYGFTNNEYAQQITNLVVPAEVGGHAITKASMYDCKYSKNLETVTVEEGIEVLSGQPFIECTNLRSVHLPESLKQIDSFTFRGCTSLESCNWPAALTTIPSCIFNDCTALRSFTVPEGVVSIKDSAFWNTGLTELMLPASLQHLEGNVLRDDHLERIYVKCAGLGTVNRPFFGADIDTVIVDGSVQNVPEALFSQATVHHVVLQEGVERVLPKAFYFSYVESISYPSTLREIGEEAFGANKLDNMNLPDGLMVLGDYAFNFAKGGLQANPSLPATLTNIGTSPLSGGPNQLPGIVFRGTLQELQSINGWDNLRVYPYITCTDAVLNYGKLVQEPSPSPSVTAEPTATQSVTAKPTATQAPSTARPTATQAPSTARPTAIPSVTARPTATQAPSTARPTATPSVTARPTATQAPSTAKPTVTPSPSVTAKPTSAPVNLPEIPGYQAGQLNGRTYYVRTSGASMLFYQKRSSGSLGRVSAPYVTDSSGKRYYPLNHGGTVLFPELSGGRISTYCLFRDGMKTPALHVLAASMPEVTNGSQVLQLNGKTYYARTSGASMLFYQKRSSGSMGRVSAPYVTDSSKTRYYPANHGGDVLIPVLAGQSFAAYTCSGNTILSESLAVPLPSSTATVTQKPTVAPTTTATVTQKPTAAPTATATVTQKPTASPTAAASLGPLTDAEIDALDVLNYDNDAYIKKSLKEAQFRESYENEYGSRIVEYATRIGPYSYYYRVKIYRDGTSVIKMGYSVEYKKDELDNKERELNGIPIPREPGDVKNMDTPTASSRFLKSDYSVWGSPSRAYLYNRPDGGFTRVEYAIVKTDDAFIKDESEGWIVVEEYSPSFAFQRKILIPQDADAFPAFGGFYAGENYNYLILGANNPQETADKEVVRIYKYTKDWKEAGYASVDGGNTREPFTWGSLDCTEHNGYLYIRTGHRIWAHTYPDGYSHQCCWTIIVRESDMTTTWQGELCFTGHENNVYVLVDQKGRFVMFDHSDGNPRAGLLQRVDAVGSDGRFSKTSGESVEFPEWGGNEDELDQITGACLGGLVETNAGYVTAYSWDGKGSTASDPRNIYVGFVSEDMKSKPVIRKIPTQGYASAPMLVSTGLDGGYVLWMDISGKPDWTDSSKWQFHYARYNEKGELGPVMTADALLSDCQPQYVNGKVVWYATDGAGPVFYELDGSGVKKTVAS